MPPRSGVRGFPAHGIAVRVLWLETLAGIPSAESRLPLRLSSFKVGGLLRQWYPGTHPRPLQHVLQSKGQRYFIQVWIGPKASAQQRALVARMVSSISVRRPRSRPPAGSGPSPVDSPSHAGFASIPGLTKIASSAWTSSLCADLKGSGIQSAQTHAPWYCAQRGLYREQVWALTAAVRRYGIHRVPQPIPLTLARHHPGPNAVVVNVLTLASPSLARRFFPIETHTSGYTALPGVAINGGIAARIDSPANDGLGEFRFAWVNGTSLVEINILGAAMTANEAKRIALLARPS